MSNVPIKKTFKDPRFENLLISLIQGMNMPYSEALHMYMEWFWTSGILEQK